MAISIGGFTRILMLFGAFQLFFQTAPAHAESLFSYNQDGTKRIELTDEECKRYGIQPAAGFDYEFRWMSVSTGMITGKGCWKWANGSTVHLMYDSSHEYFFPSSVFHSAADAEVVREKLIKEAEERKYIAGVLARAEATKAEKARADAEAKAAAVAAKAAEAEAARPKTWITKTWIGDHRAKGTVILTQNSCKDIYGSSVAYKVAIDGATTHGCWFSRDSFIVVNVDGKEYTFSPSDFKQAN